MFWYASLGFSLWEAVRAFHRYHLYCNLWHGNTRIIGLSTITSVLFAAVELCKRSLRATPTQTKPMLGTRLCPLPSATIGQIERQKEARLGRRRPTEGVNGKQRLCFRKLNTTYIKSSIINSFSGDPHYANDLHSRKQVFFHILLAFHPFDGPFPLFAYSFYRSFLPRPVSKVSTHAISACTRSCS